LIAHVLSDPASKYKVIQLGPALALEYLRNVGLDAVKPDLHVLRIAGPDRIALIDDISNPKDVARNLMKLAKDSKYTAVQVDLALWLLGARGYGEICAAKPKCYLCGVFICTRKC